LLEPVDTGNPHSFINLSNATSNFSCLPLFNNTPETPAAPDVPPAPPDMQPAPPAVPDVPPSYNVNDILTHFHDVTGSQYDFTGGGNEYIYAEPDIFYEEVPILNLSDVASMAGIKNRKKPNYI